MHINKSIGSTVNRNLLLFVLVTLILYFGKTLFIPLFFGLLIAIIMYPISKRLELHKWSRAMAITACLLIVTVLFAGLLALVIWQVDAFSKNAPAIISKTEKLIQQIQLLLSSKFGITFSEENSLDKNQLGNIGSLINSTFKTTANTLFILFITPVFTALFMYHRKIYVQFLKSIIPSKYEHQLDAILKKTIDTYFNYIKGMILVYIIVGILNSIGLYALGVQNALLFGMLCAIMTIVPYVGIFISALLPISVIWLQTGNIWYPIGVVAIFSFVQYLEANVIFPKIVGTQLNLSTMAMLVAVVVGGMVWGVSGMILFIPFVAILKIISEDIDELKPINMLLSR